MPSSRERATICFCSAYCAFMNERGNGPPMPAPYSFWPRDHVRNAGPLNQARTSVSERPTDVSAR